MHTPNEDRTTVRAVVQSAGHYHEQGFLCLRSTVPSMSAVVWSAQFTPTRPLTIDEAANPSHFLLCLRLLYILALRICFDAVLFFDVRVIIFRRLALAPDFVTMEVVKVIKAKEESVDNAAEISLVDTAYLRSTVYRSLKRTYECFSAEHFQPPTSLETW